MPRPILLRNGTVISGQRHATAQRRDVLISGERITRIAPQIERGQADVIDATGLVVAPGFIDAHSHSDIFALLDSSAQSRVFDGVTSEVNGTCGLSMYPLEGPGAEARRESLRKLEIEPKWSGAAGYMEQVEKFGSAVNRAFMCGHGAIRAAVTGHSARRANARELRKMARLLAESLDAGAAGLSSGLCYPPGCFAHSSELSALCRTLGAYGRPYATHMRSEGHGLLKSVRESLTAVRSGHAPLQISHVKTMGPANWYKIDILERALFGAREQGVDVTGDRYPYLAAATGLSSILPDWVMAGGRDRALQRLQQPGTRKRLLLAMAEGRRGKAPWNQILVSSTDDATREFEGLTVDQIAERMKLAPSDAVLELLSRAKLTAGAIFFEMCEPNLERILRWPFICVGSDSSSRALKGPTAQGRPHPRTFGTFSRYLSEYILKKKLMPLPEAIWRITGFPAQRFGLKDRGVLAEGAFADVVCFDTKRIRDRSTYAAPYQLSEGVAHLFVNGKAVLRNGRQTAARPGKVLRVE